MDKSDTLYYHFASLEKLFNDEFYNHPQLAQVLVLLNEIKHKSAALEVKNRALCDEINFLWNTAYEPMAITNYQQQILKVNTAYSKLVNKSPAQLLGENIFTMYDNPLQSSHAQAFDALTKSPQLITKNKTKATLWNGKQLYLESTLLKYTYNDKKNVLHILRDVTESEVHQEEQYLFMKALLHDTRNLLHGLQAYHQLLYDDLTPLLLPANFQEEKQKTIMQTKQQEWYQEFPLLNTYLKTTGNLIHSLTFIVQTYSKMLAVETGAIFPTPTSLYPSDCIKNLTKVLEPQLTKKKLVLKNLIPEHCCAYADPNFITPIFYNYFVNAIKFSNKGTNIEVGLQPYPKKHDFLELYVKDYGQGIPPEKLATLFKRAEVKSTSGTLGEKGSGLGLYICQVFAEKCNGYVYATSDAEKGATFYLGLPKCSHDTTG